MPRFFRAAGTPRASSRIPNTTSAATYSRDDPYVGKDPILMVRTNEWKYNHLRWGRCELFDLRKDAGEHRNVIDETGNAGVVKELRSIAERIYNP